MGRRLLILGGTNFIGKRLVRALLERGASVTIASRGRRGDEFGERVKRLTIDRTDRASMAAAMVGHTFDTVIDMIGFAADDLADALAALAGRVGRYVFCSSQIVYYDRKAPRISESAYDPTDPAHGWRTGRFPADLSYREGKQQAEAYLFQRGQLPAAALRLPMVLGPDDPTGRLPRLVAQLRRGDPVVIPPTHRAAMSYIPVDDAGAALAHLALCDATGPFNAASPETYTGHELVAQVAAAMDLTARILDHGPTELHTDYAQGESLTLNTTRLADAGFTVSPLSGRWRQTLSINPD